MYVFSVNDNYQILKDTFQVGLENTNELNNIDDIELDDLLDFEYSSDSYHPPSDHSSNSDISGTLYSYYYKLTFNNLLIIIFSYSQFYYLYYNLFRKL